MNNHFIQRVIIKDVRDIQNFEIPLDENERKHLIITGKNGSGKTSTLIEINNLLKKLINNGAGVIERNKKNIDNYTKAIQSLQNSIKNYEKNLSIQLEKKNKTSNKQELLQIENHIKSYNSNIINTKNNIKNYKNSINRLEKEIENFSKVDLIFSNQNSIYDDIVSRKFILAYFKAKRENRPTVSNSIQNISLSPNYTTDTDRLHTKFIEYMVKLRVDMLDAKEENELDEVKRIENWFKHFEDSLKELFETDNLKLKYYRKELNFKIEYDNKSFGLNELSDGYSSLLAILTELILRMEAHGAFAYDMQGVVLVDEIETHLHVALQKKVLPFLTSFFKNIQFIVTTHSPFVISSISNAVICDLEKRFVTRDLSAYSYDALIESYFDNDKYSREIKRKIDEFEKLSTKNKLSDNEKDEFYRLKKYFNSLPTFRADELAVKINEIKLKNMFKG